jgi:sulfur carrier protein ThiS
MATKIPVKVAKLGGKAAEVGLVTATTIADVLKMADLSQGGHDIMLNGKNAKLTDIVEPGDIVALVPQIRGGV